MFQKKLSWQRIRSIFCTTQISTGECCLGECCVSSWRRYGLKQGISWYFLVSLYSMFQKKLSWHRIRLIFWTTQGRTGKCCLGESCVGSWSCYGLKQVIPWKFLWFLSVLFLLFFSVNENHQHVHGWNTDTTTSFT